MAFLPLAMSGTTTTTSQSRRSSVQWGITVLLVVLVNVYLWMGQGQFGGNSKEIMLCGEQVKKLPIVHGADRHHAAGGVSVSTTNTSMEPLNVPSSVETNTNSAKTTDLLKADTAVKPKEEDLPTVFEGVRARPFTPHSYSKNHPNQNQSLPCFPPEPNWRDVSVQMTPSDVGFLFLKAYKTGSSTSSGINLRMARNVARQHHQQHDKDNAFEICRSRFHHAWASDRYATRKVDDSFLWTVIRSPAQRIVSQFFHFEVSRHKLEPSDWNFINYIRSAAKNTQKGVVFDYYLGALSTVPYRPGNHTSTSQKVETANRILKDYDFIGITERMDESVVALSMLNGLALADVLYLKAKGHGGFDDAGGRKDNTCTYIWPSFVSDGMQAFFETEEWKEIIHWDSVLYQAANRSLDMTIDQLGRPEFEQQLAKYQHAKEIVHDRCLPVTVFPCSAGGKFSRETATDCLWRDSGCGMSCMDQVSTELDLW
jgi:hypothetical protein